MAPATPKCWLFSSPELGVTLGGSLGTEVSCFQVRGGGPGPAGAPRPQAEAVQWRGHT